MVEFSNTYPFVLLIMHAVASFDFKHGISELRSIKDVEGWTD